MVAMFFWTWAKGLEDRFDGANRRNLRSFIVARDDVDGKQATFAVGAGTTDVASENGIAEVDYASHQAPSAVPSDGADYYYMAHKSTSEDDDTYSLKGEERRELVRIDSCAIFHKLSSGQGVPHSFVGFIRQWPALPRVVIFLSVRILPMARVAPEERYVVNKVNAVQGAVLRYSNITRSLTSIFIALGFYSASYYLGFRDDFDVQIEALVDRICALETRHDPAGSGELVASIRRWATTATHIVPHYHVVSRPVRNLGALNPVIDWMRSILIESVYRHLAAMFPETKNWLSSADEIIRVGVNAAI
jgi:KUP system potassium uptake protein